jgi:transposase
MRRDKLSDEAWSRIEHRLPGRPESPGMTTDNRLVINAVLWIARPGAPGPDRLERFGHGNRVFPRFHRGAQRGGLGPGGGGVGRRRRPGVAADRRDCGPCPSTCRGGRNKGGTTRREAARGGFSIQVQVAVDALGHPVKVILTAGQAHDLSRAKDLITGHKPASVIAAKGEDSNEFVAAVEAQGAQAVIPPRSTRKTPREDDKPLDQERNRVERFLNRGKPDRRVATRDEKTGRNFLAF